MKKLLYLFLALGISSVSFGQTTLIPDPNFEQALIDLGYDTLPIDGSVPTANISNVASLNVNSQNISDLTGIEDFSALEDLSCAANQLTSLDVSNNPSLAILFCGLNQLTSLDVSNNSALTELYLYENQLTSLDVSNNPSLAFLFCDGNQLTSLDVSNNPSLVVLVCSQNQLTSLDVSNNPSLDGLFCDGNQLTSLDVSNNPSLVVLVCSQNQLTSLDVRNEANTLIIEFFAFDNPNLTCIYVDNAEYSTQNWTDIDPNSTFVENEAECEALAVADNPLDADLILYPSPTDNYLFIQGTAGQFSATVYNMLGKQVLNTQNTDKIDVSGLSDGVYIIKISDGVNETQRKFIKN
jgi:hypothetical protein